MDTEAIKREINRLEEQLKEHRRISKESYEVKLLDELQTTGRITPKMRLIVSKLLEVLYILPEISYFDENSEIQSATPYHLYILQLESIPIDHS